MAQPLPFPCAESTIFISQGDPTQLASLVYGNGSSQFIDIGTPVSPAYNAIGFNRSDDFIYAVNDDNQVIRVDSNGTLTILGAPQALVGGSGVFDVGTFDQSGTFWVQRSTESVIYAVTLAPLSARSVTLSSLPGASDLAFLGGFLWGQVGGQSALVRVNTTTGNVTRFTVSFIPPTVTGGAAWTYGNGNLGINDKNTGAIYQIAIANPGSATPTFTLVASAPGPATSTNDGSACAGQSTDLSITKSGPAMTSQGVKITWTLTVHDGGPGDSSGYVVSDTVPSSVSNVSSPTPGCDVAGQTVTCVGGALPAGEDATITLEGTVVAGIGETITNSASVLGNESDPDSTNDDSTATTSVVGSCGNGSVEAGEQCDDGSANGTPRSCCSSACEPQPSGTTCDDGSLCTRMDRCNGSAVCVGSNPVVCQAEDVCHDAGKCDAATGACSNPAFDPIAAILADPTNLSTDERALQCLLFELEHGQVPIVP